MDGVGAWALIKGDGLAYQGLCIVLGFIFWPDANGDYADVYDGLDATGGKKFCRIESAVQSTWPVTLPIGVQFDRGIYVDGIDGAVETLCLFIPLP